MRNAGARYVKTQDSETLFTDYKCLAGNPCTNCYVDYCRVPFFTTVLLSIVNNVKECISIEQKLSVAQLKVKVCTLFKCKVNIVITMMLMVIIVKIITHVCIKVNLYLTRNI